MIFPKGVPTRIARQLRERADEDLSSIALGHFFGGEKFTFGHRSSLQGDRMAKCRRPLQLKDRR